MRFTFILFVFFPFSSSSQFVIPAVEPILGINYYKSTVSYEDSQDYAGISFYYGLRAHCLIGNRITLSTGAGIKQYPYDLDYFITTSIKTYVFRNYQTGFSVFCELGGEISDWGGLTLPFYLGTNQYMGESVSFNFRFRIPTFLDVKYLETVGHVELGMEAGLQFDITKRRTKKVTRSGNPFILI